MAVTRLPHRFSNFLTHDEKKRRLAIFVGFFLIVASLVATAFLTYWSTRRDFTSFTLSQRQAVAYFAATALKEKLDRMVDITVSLASRVRFRELVGANHWAEAISILREVPKDFPFIDRIYITDVQGNVVAVTPAAPDHKGRNVNNRDWYQTVNKNWQPYVSRVYQRTTGEKNMVVAVAAPITSADGKRAGILVANVDVGFLLGWTQGIAIGPNGRVLIVDQKGGVAADPHITSGGEILDYSKVPVVEKVLRGERGIEVVSDPMGNERHAVAYEPVPAYGWGAIVQQPEANAFALRDQGLSKLLVAYLIAAGVTGCVGYLLWRFVSQRRHAEARFRSLIDSAPDAMVMAEKSGIITFVNTQAERLFGYKREEMVGQRVEMLLPERYGQIHVVHREHYFNDPHVRPMGGGLDLYARRKDGSEFPVEISLSPLETDEGMVVTTSIRDITERKQAEILIRDGRIFAESVVDTVRHPLLVLDRDLRVKSANRSFYRAFKTTPQETENKIFYELAYGVWNEPRLRTLLEQIFSHDTPLVDFNVDRDIPGVGRRIVRLNARRLRRNGTDSAMVLLAIEDITTQARYEEELHRKTEELAAQNRLVHEANRLKSEFLANMSHELRTPLNAIIGFAQLMHDGRVGPVSTDHKEYLGDILASGRHLLHLINDILDLAKIEAGRLEIKPEAVSLSRIVFEVKQILHALTTQKQLDVETEISPAVENVFIDPAKLKQVLYNYLANATKFTPERGRIVIRALPEGSDRFRLEVEDNGVGMKADQIHKLFVEFQQLDGGTSKRYPGTGLGLALTKKLVEAQGGEVGVQSIHGRGSLFYAVLPRITLFHTAAEGNGQVTTPSIKDRPTVLVIEDNEKDLQWLARILLQAGYVPETARSGREALAKAQTTPYHAILLDLILPDMVGWDVLHSIRTLGPNQETPVIVVTVVPESEVAKAFPVEDYLTKPISPDTLMNAIEQARVRGGARDSNRKILVVDDDSTTLKVASAALKASGYQVSCHSNSRHGLEAAVNDEFAAVVLDLLMPGMDGFDFLDRLRELPTYQRVPVIVWTNKDITAADRLRLESSAQSVALKGRHGIEAILNELKRHVPMDSETETTRGGYYGG